MTRVESSETKIQKNRILLVPLNAVFGVPTPSFYHMVWWIQKCREKREGEVEYLVVRYIIQTFGF